LIERLGVKIVFNYSGRFSSLLRDVDVNLAVFDVRRHLVNSIVDTKPSGVYFYKIKAGAWNETRSPENPGRFIVSYDPMRFLIPLVGIGSPGDLAGRVEVVTSVTAISEGEASLQGDSLLT
jgi:hypothetical protein